MGNTNKKETLSNLRILNKGTYGKLELEKLYQEDHVQYYIHKLETELVRRLPLRKKTINRILLKVFGDNLVKSKFSIFKIWNK